MASENDYSDLISRRRFIELTGVSGAAALAGCTGDGDDDTTEDGGADGEDGGDGGDDDYPDQRHVGVTTANPTNIQFNPINTENEPEISQYLLFEPYAKYNYQDEEYTAGAVEDWEFTGDAFEMTLRDDLVWTDGEDVTADDVVTQLKIAEYDEDPMWSWAESVEADGDLDVVVNVAEDVNPALVETDVLQRWVQMADATYGDRLSDLESGDAEIADVRGFDDTEPVTNGPFAIEDRSEQGLLTSRHDDSPYAEDINFGEYMFQTFSDNQGRQQALLNNQVDSDFSLTVNARNVANFPDAVEEVQTPDVFGVGLAPNHNHAHAGDRAVRQAIAYVINRQLCVDNSLPRVKQAPEIATPISSDYQESWLDVDSYRSYGHDETMADEATQVLEDAGYSTSGGTWEDEDGNSVDVEILTPGGWGDWTIALETAIDSLDDFGFNASLATTDSYFDQLVEPDNWAFIANTWLHGGPTPYPYYSLLHALHEPQQHAAHTNYPGYTEQYGGSSADITVPGRDGGGDVTVNPGDRLEELAQTTDEGTEEEIIQELAWVANVDLPRIPILEKQLQQWVTDDEWDVPENVNEDVDANVEWAPTWLPRKGKMNYSG